MIETKKPKVFLMTNTPDPKMAVALATHAWHSDNFPESMAEIAPEYAYKLAEKAMTDFHSTALEYVTMTFVIKNVSRAFQQQLTRTRIAAYAIQSLRIVTKKEWATIGHFTKPPGFSYSQQEQFCESMLEIENSYESLLGQEVDPQDARAILPLAIHSDISFTINFNALRHMMKQRLCVLTQHEYRQVARLIKQQVSKYMGDIFGDQFKAPCVHVNKCPMGDEYCGIPVWKYNADEQLDIYERFVYFKKEGQKWNITWSGDERPSYIDLENLI